MLATLLNHFVDFTGVLKECEATGIKIYPENDTAADYMQNSQLVPGPV